MGKFLLSAVLLCHSLLLLFGVGNSLPLCINSRTPFTLDKVLTFCPYNETSCCNSKDDLQLQKQYQSMNISDSGCASFIKSVLCSKCDPFSGELYVVNSVTKQVPILCNSTASEDSPQTDQAASNFCSDLWDTCQNVSVLNSPFSPTLVQSGIPLKSNSTKLTDVWQSKTDFCDAFGGASSDGSVCFGGEPVALNDTVVPVAPSGMCLEKIGNESYLNMVAHPDGSNRAFFSSQEGKIWLATIPEEGSGGTLGFDKSSPFVDLTDEVHFDTQFGMMGMAFHPNFAQNGRFFASFNCDKVKWPGCAGRCSCNSDANCDPSKLSPDNGAQPCQFQTVVAEYTTNGTEADPSKATSAKPVEVRRIFTMGLPFTSHHGGQILFGPTDGYLYVMMGDGGGEGGDPYNFSQNKKSLLGKIMRLDVDNIPTEGEIDKLGLWGNYSIPKDNPFKEDSKLLPEIWALGLRNPWRCSFDSERPSYFVCADTGQDLYEEVDLITKGGNYGWRILEGPYPFYPSQTPGGNTSLDSIEVINPVLGYNHSEVNNSTNSASIIGGYIYRSQSDPCLYGRYLYADLYGGFIWGGVETPANSGIYSTDIIPFSCAADSPIECKTVSGSTLPALEYVFSFGEDNKKDVFILAKSGVYRVIPPGRCNYSCSKESATAGSGSPVLGPAGSSPGSNHADRSVNSRGVATILVLLSLLSLFSSVLL